MIIELALEREDEWGLRLPFGPPAVSLCVCAVDVCVTL